MTPRSARGAGAGAGAAGTAPAPGPPPRIPGELKINVRINCQCLDKNLSTVQVRFHIVAEGIEDSLRWSANVAII